MSCCSFSGRSLYDLDPFLIQWANNDLSQIHQSVLHCLHVVQKIRKTKAFLLLLLLGLKSLCSCWHFPTFKNVLPSLSSFLWGESFSITLYNLLFSVLTFKFVDVNISLVDRSSFGIAQPALMLFYFQYVTTYFN